MYINSTYNLPSFSPIYRPRAHSPHLISSQYHNSPGPTAVTPPPPRPRPPTEQLARHGHCTRNVPRASLPACTYSSQSPLSNLARDDDDTPHRNCRWGIWNRRDYPTCSCGWLRGGWLRLLREREGDGGWESKSWWKGGMRGGRGGWIYFGWAEGGSF